MSSNKSIGGNRQPPYPDSSAAVPPRQAIARKPLPPPSVGESSQSRTLPQRPKPAPVPARPQAAEPEPVQILTYPPKSPLAWAPLPPEATRPERFRQAPALPDERYVDINGVTFPGVSDLGQCPKKRCGAAFISMEDLLLAKEGRAPLFGKSNYTTWLGRHGVTYRDHQAFLEGLKQRTGTMGMDAVLFRANKPQEKILKQYVKDVVANLRARGVPLESDWKAPYADLKLVEIWLYHKPVKGAAVREQPLTHFPLPRALNPMIDPLAGLDARAYGEDHQMAQVALARIRGETQTTNHNAYWSEGMTRRLETIRFPMVGVQTVWTGGSWGNYLNAIERINVNQTNQTTHSHNQHYYKKLEERFGLRPIVAQFILKEGAPAYNEHMQRLRMTKASYEQTCGEMETLRVSIKQQHIIGHTSQAVPAIGRLLEHKNGELKNAGIGVQWLLRQLPFIPPKYEVTIVDTAQMAQLQARDPMMKEDKTRVFHLK